MSTNNNGIRKHFSDWVSVLQYYELKDENVLKLEDYDNIEITSKPKKNTIKKIEIFDFDGTLFYTPNIFHDSFTDRAINYIIPFKGLINGGWWCYRESVEAYIKKWLNEKGKISEELVFNKPSNDNEEVCFCESCKIDSKYWSYDIVQKMSRSYNDPHTLSIVMTGRRLDRFYETFSMLFKGEIKNRTVFHQELKMDSIFLKKDFKYTIEYKTKVMKDLLINFPLVSDLIMYDDRTDQIKGMHTWMKNNQTTIKDIRYRKNANRPKAINFDIQVVKPKVGRYESKEQLTLIEGLITRNNKNCCEQQISIDVEIYSDYYIAIEQNDTRFLKSLVDFMIPVKYRNDYSKNNVIGIQFLHPVNVDRKISKVDWIIDSINVCSDSIFVSIYNKGDVNETGVIITHYKGNHRETIKKMKHDIKKNISSLRFPSENVTFDLNEKKKLYYTETDIKGYIDVNQYYQWSNMDLTEDNKLILGADFKNINNLMLIDLKESDE